VPRGVKTESSEAISDYLAEHSRQDAVLAQVEEEIRGHPRARMQVSPDQGALLTLLVQATGARDALEIGTFTGYSAICIARGLPAEDGRLTCLEIDPDFARTAQRNLERAGVADRVEIVVAPAEETLAASPAEPTYDFAFIDADKQTYADYYELVLPRLKTGGLLLIDNSLLGGRVVDPQDETARAVAALNDRIAADERVDSAMALIADGVTFARKR
jgi:caffeoyl-CoA O-methyltransferase